MLKLYLLMMVMALLLLVTSAWADDAQKSPPPRLTQAQVLKIAQNFCQKIGQPVSVSGTAQYPTSPDVIRDWYYQPRWQVTFPRQAELEVVDATGVVNDYDNEAHNFVEDNSPPGQAIPKQQAVDAAWKVAAATGQQEELLLTDPTHNATLEQGHVPPRAK